MSPFPVSRSLTSRALGVSLLALFLSVRVASALTASYTTGAEVPLSAAGYTATGQTVNFTLNYAPTPGTTLTVVEKTGFGFIQGTFDNLPNGAPVDLSFGGNSYHFVAWYYGGDGNDLVLQWRDTGLAAWGLNNNGQLGDGSTTNRNVPVAVTQSGVLIGKTVVAIASGSSHTVALCADGTVATWGDNLYGQLGDGSPSSSDRLVPIDITQSGALSGKTVIAIAAGDYYSLALCSDGTLAAWGRNLFGSLGNGSTNDSFVPVAVDQSGVLSGKTVVAIDAGSFHSLALCSDGTLAAWGGNVFGSLGNGSTIDRFVPVAVDQSGVLSGKNVVAIDAGGRHNLALCSDGTLAAWGSNSSGKLGDGSTTDRLVPVDVTQSGVLSGHPIRGLADLGSFYSFAIYAVELEIAVEQPVGIDLTDGSSSIDFGTPALAGASLGRTFTVRNAGTGELVGLGVTFDGTHAGDFSLIRNPAPILPPGESTTFTVQFSPSSPGAKTAVLHLASNDGDENPFDISLTGSGSATTSLSATFSSSTDLPLSTSALTATGQTVNFTLNYPPAPGTTLTVVEKTGFGFIQGNFDNLPNGAPVDLSYNGSTYPFVAYYYGGEGNNDLVLLWRATGLAAWGDAGALGYEGIAQFEATPVPVDQSGVLAGKTIVQVAVGGYHSLALCSDGTVAAWGKNDWGQLGDGSLNDRRLPVLVNASGPSALNGKTVISVAAGENHSQALCTDGTIVFWGRYSNQLSSRYVTPSALDTRSGISALHGKTVVSMCTSAFHGGRAVCSDGSVVHWGSVSLNNNFNFPTLVDAGPSSALHNKTVKSLSGTSALCTDGTVVAWGSHSSGQLGDNTTNDTIIPVRVNTDDGVSALFGKTVTAIAGSGSHTIALCSDGTLAAWGYNGSGQLGDNSTTQRNAPVAVNTDSGTSALFEKNSGVGDQLRSSQSGSVLRRHARLVGFQLPRQTRRRHPD